MNVRAFKRYDLLNCIVARWSDKRCLSHGMCLYQIIMTLLFLNNVVMSSTQKFIIVTS